MHFDDRLATVLQHRAAGERAARVQFRQLLDLLGETQGGTDRGLARAAYRRLDALGLQLSLVELERLAGECSSRIRNPQLLAWFAAAEPRVALAALARAALSEEQWLALIPEMPIRARGLLRHRRTLPRSALRLLDRLGVHDRVLPEPHVVEQFVSPPVPEEEEATATALDLGRFSDEDYVIEPGPVAAPEPGTASANAIPGAGNLGDLVRRIEAFQRARQGRAAEPVRHDAPRLPLPGEDEDIGARHPLAAFHFTTDDTGRVDWAEGASAPLVVGARLAAPGGANGSNFATAFARRRPVSGIAHELAGAEAIGGRWIVDAAPRFAPVTGRFTGYVGRFRRPAPAPADDAGA